MLNIIALAAHNKLGSLARRRPLADDIDDKCASLSYEDESVLSK